MDQVYYPLVNLYGHELHDFLLGVNGMNDTNLFNVMFIVLVIISMGLLPGFYYKMWDRATWATTGKWLIMLLINAVIIFLLNFIWVYSLKNDMVDVDGNYLSINDTNFIAFGIASSLISCVGFFLGALVWKTQSTNCPHIPF